jgi:hypothetical protein
MDHATRAAVKSEFFECVEQTFARLDEEDTHKPFHSALLSPEAVQWSRFERSFSTSFGQRGIERIAKLVVEASGASKVVAQKRTVVTLKQIQWDEIDQLINQSRRKELRKRTGYAPDWEQDLGRVVTAGDFGAGAVLTNEIISDLFWVRDGIEHYVSIKTPKPNLDQTEKAKRDLLALGAAQMSRKVYFGLPYNPYGEEQADYSWTAPKNMFNFTSDASVLIGQKFWDELGGEGTYAALVEVAQEAGAELRPRFVDFIRTEVQVELETMEEVTD